MYTDVRLWQPWKADAPTLLTLAEMNTASSLVHPAKAEGLMSLTVSGMTTCVASLQAADSVQEEHVMLGAAGPKALADAHSKNSTTLVVSTIVFDIQLEPKACACP